MLQDQLSIGPPYALTPLEIQIIALAAIAEEYQSS